MQASARTEALEQERLAERLGMEALTSRYDRLTEEHRALQLVHTKLEAREEVAVSALREVQAENARLLEAGRWRDEGLSSQLGELHALTDAAEARATELAAAVSQATKPLSRQIAQLQAQQLQLQQAAAATEAALRAKLAAAEAATAHTADKLATASKALETMRARESELEALIEQEVAARKHTESKLEAAADAAAQKQLALRGELDSLQTQLDASIEQAASAADAERRAAARSDEASAALRTERERHAVQLQSERTAATAAVHAAAADARRSALASSATAMGEDDFENADTAVDGVPAMRQMRDAAARRQEGTQCLITHTWLL